MPEVLELKDTPGVVDLAHEEVKTHQEVANNLSRVSSMQSVVPPTQIIPGSNQPALSGDARGYASFVEGDSNYQPSKSAPPSYGNTHLLGSEGLGKEFELRTGRPGSGKASDFLAAKIAEAEERGHSYKGDQSQSKLEENSKKGILGKMSEWAEWFYENNEEKQEARKN